MCPYYVDDVGVDAGRISNMRPGHNGLFLKHGRSGAENSLDKIESHFVFFLNYLVNFFFSFLFMVAL